MTARQIVLDADFARGVEGGGGFGQRLFEEVEYGGLAAPLERELVGGWLGGGRGTEEMAQGGEARGPVFGGKCEGAPLFEGGDRFQLAQETFGAGARLAFVAEEQGAESAQAGVGDLLADVEIEAVGGGKIGEAGGEAQGGEGSRVVPAAEHGFDGTGEKAHDGVAFEGGVEIEARRDAEAFEGGAQCGHVDIGSAHDDGDLAEGASGGGLFEDAAGDLFDFALDAGRLDEGECGMGAAGLESLLRCADGGEARAEGGSQIFVAEGESEIGVAGHGGHDAQLGIGQGVEAVHANGIDAGQAVSVDLGGGEFKAAGAHGEPAARQFAIDLLVDGQEGRAQRDVGEAGGEAGAIAAGGGELFDGVRQGIAEAVEARDARKLGAGDALRGLFHQEVEHGGGDLGRSRRRNRR